MSSTSSTDPARVLLVDDNEVMLARAAALLRSECVIVGAVKDATAAVEAAGSSHPDVIVLDISMPGLNGFEVATRLRQAGSTAAIVFLTVHNDEAFVLAARAAGGIGYVVKPRLGCDLILAVREARAGRPFVSSIH